MIEDTRYLEQVMTKALMCDKDYVVTITRVFEDDYFDCDEVKTIFNFTKSYFEQYKEIPQKEVLINSLSTEAREPVNRYLSEIENIEIDIARNRDWLLKQSDLYLRDKAIKDAIRKSVDIIEGNDDTQNIRTMVEHALCRTIDIDLGLNYFDDLNTRLTRMFSDDTQRIPTYFPVFDEFINGGFPPKTLSVFVAKIHGFKSNTMVNMAARQVLQGIYIVAHLHTLICHRGVHRSGYERHPGHGHVDQQPYL